MFLSTQQRDILLFCSENFQLWVQNHGQRSLFSLFILSMFCASGRFMQYDVNRDVSVLNVVQMVTFEEELSKLKAEINRLRTDKAVSASMITQMQYDLCERVGLQSALTHRTA
jgi:hypothetical protein